MRYVAGIDGGQSGTTALIAGEDGRVIGRGNAGPADEVGVNVESSRLSDALHEALADAARSAGLTQDARFSVVVAGVSGYEGRIYGKPPALPADRVLIVHDAVIAHAGAFGEGPGLLLIAGTGSVALARASNGDAVTVGGWGYVFGDEGSAFWLARLVLADAMRREEDASALVRAALERFSQPSLRALARAFYAGAIARREIADFARTVLEMAAAGDRAAAEYAVGAAQALGDLAGRAARAGALEPDARVAAAGGMTRSLLFRDALEDAVLQRLPQARWVRRTEEPAAGAVLLAMRHAGWAVNPV